MKRFWGRSLSGQFIGLVLLSVALAQLVSVLVFRFESTRRLSSVIREEFLGRVGSAYRVVRATPPDQREETLQMVSTPLSRYWISDSQPPSVPEWQQAAREQLVRHLPGADRDSNIATLFDGESMLDLVAEGGWELKSADAWMLGVPMQIVSIPDWNGYGLALQLEDGTWLNAVYAKPAYLVPTATSPMYYVALAGVAVVFSAGAWFIARRISRPLRQLTHATERLGRGEEVEPLAVAGPEDIQSTISTFNRMQVRLRRFVEDRTRMLAAIGHDLRTPITSLRLRAEYVSDPDTREKLLSTIAEMQAMSEATLAFARSESTAESTRVMDLNALVESLCDDLAELGWKVDFEGNGRVSCACRPDSLRRAIRNIIENAVRYGERARVTLLEHNDYAEVIVEDDGPGIPEKDREYVFTPFVRLEHSRNRNTGGVGLGLAIARTTLRGHGGDIMLEGGAKGLRVRLQIPHESDVLAASRPVRL